jgi:hypothetical protein
METPSPDAHENKPAIKRTQKMLSPLLFISLVLAIVAFSMSAYAYLTSGISPALYVLWMYFWIFIATLLFFKKDMKNVIIVIPLAAHFIWIYGLKFIF